MLLSWVTAAWLLDRHGLSRPEPTGHWDSIVVPGCTVLPDGSPGLPLRQRTRKAVQLWHRGLAPRVLFTGGLANGPRTEAETAAEYAVALGLPRRASVLERESQTTVENAHFAAVTLGAVRVLVVTDSYHVLRAGYVFSRFFPEVAVAVSELPWPVRLRCAMREVVAMFHFALIGCQTLERLAPQARGAGAGAGAGTGTGTESKRLGQQPA